MRPTRRVLPVALLAVILIIGFAGRADAVFLDAVGDPVLQRFTV